MNEVIIRAEGISKLFPGVRALDDIDFDLRKGEVHILVGENGAGKSTLAKVLLGAYQPDCGKIFFEGEEISFPSANAAIEKGIVAVYQEFTLVPYLNVAQNIFLNREHKNKLGLIDHKQMQKEARELLDTLGCEYISAKSIVKELSVAEQQMVEIAKALSFKPRVIVFDEPTAAISDKEVDALFEQIHKLKADGIGIIYVSHRMQEFPLIGDRITVLRDGKKISTIGINDCTNEELVNMMVGRDISQVYVKRENDYDEMLLEVIGLSDKQGLVNDIDLKVGKGEIVGIAGLVGAGRTEIAELIFGIRKIGSGEIYLNGEKIIPKTPSQMMNAGIGLVSEDRKQQGLALDLSIAWNVVSTNMKETFPKKIVSEKVIEDIAMGYKVKLNIATPDARKPCVQLSGGNQQKVVLAKWLEKNPDLYIFDEPTRGIDVGAKMEIYALMDELASQGKGILMISSEMAEVVGMSDRIYVMHEGSIKGE